MSKVVVIAKIIAKAKNEDLVSNAIDSLALATRQEAGCETYDVYVSTSDEPEFLIHEIWSDSDSLVAHGQTAHIATFKSAIKGRADVTVQKLSMI